MYPNVRINRSKYPLSASPTYRVLLAAEDHGCFSLSTEECYIRCKESDATLNDAAVAADIDALLAHNRIVKHGAEMLTMNTWEDENELAKHLAERLKNNDSPRLGYFDPFPIESKLTTDHLMKAVVEDAALFHLTHKLSIAIVDSPQEMKWLVQALGIKTGMITPFYMNVVCATTNRAADAIKKSVDWAVHGLPTVLHSNSPIDEVDFGCCRYRAMWLTTTVVLNEDSFFTPQMLMELLKNSNYGNKVILIAERRLLDMDEGSLLQDLLRIGFPATFVGEANIPVIDSARCETHLVTQTKMLASEATA